MTGPTIADLAGLLLRGTLLLAVCLTLCYALRRSSAAQRHLILALGLGGLLLIPALAVGLPAWDLPVLPAGPSEPTGPAPRAAAASTVLEAGDFGAMEDAEPTSWVAASSDATQGRARAARPLGLGAALVTLWLIGAGLMLGRLLTGVLRVRWIVRRSEPIVDGDSLALLDRCRRRLGLAACPRLQRSDLVAVPLIWGWLRPVLLLPQDAVTWPTERLRVVFMHELAHLRRADGLVLLVGRVVAALYWFHPLVRIAERAARRECERACDDQVLGHGIRPSDYAEHILAIARNLRGIPPQAALALVSDGRLEVRVRAILDPCLSRSFPTRRRVAGAAVAAVVVLLPFASAELVPRTQAGPPSAEPARPAAPGGSDGGTILLARKQATQAKVRAEASAFDRPAADDGKGWFKLGSARHRAGDYGAAEDAFKTAIALDYRVAASAYNIACGRALSGDTRRALEWFDRAREAGWDQPEALITDSDFDPLRRDPEFQAYVDRAFAAAGLVRDSERHFPYRTALGRLDALRAARSTDVDAWHEVGSRLLQYREYDAAIQALSAAAALPGESGRSMYNLACAYSLTGDSEEALGWLDRALDAGFSQHHTFLRDPDLDPLRGQVAFQRLLDKSEFLSLDRFPRRQWEETDYSEKRWAPAIEEYREYASRHPDSGRAWFNLGYALHFSGRHDEAVAAFKKAEAQAFRPATTGYNIACALAMSNRPDAALEWLERSTRGGDISASHVWNDDDLIGLRGDPRFKALVERLDVEHDRRHRELKQKKLKEKHRRERDVADDPAR